MPEKTRDSLTEQPGWDLIEALQLYFRELEALTPAAREERIGKHPAVSFLRDYAEGRVDYSKEHARNKHLALCAECADRVLRFEQQHIQNLSAETPKILNFPIRQFYRPALDKLAAATASSVE